MNSDKYLFSFEKIARGKESTSDFRSPIIFLYKRGESWKVNVNALKVR